MTPLISVWFDGTAHFCTDPEEQRTRNLERHPACTLTPGFAVVFELVPEVAYAFRRGTYSQTRYRL